MRFGKRGAAVLALCFGLLEWLVAAPNGQQAARLTEEFSPAPKLLSKPRASLRELLGCGSQLGTALTSASIECTSPTLAADATESSAALRLPDIAEFERYLNSKRSRKVVIGLEGIVARTVAKNLNIKIHDLGVQSALFEIDAQRGIYDLRLGASLSIDRSQYPPPYASTPPTGMTEVQKEKDKSVGASVGQLLPTGGLLELLFQQSAVDNNSPLYYSPYFTSGAGVQLSQPLLKNAGRYVTNAGIRLAELSSKLATETCRQQLFVELTKSISLYYELIYATANVDVLRISLAQAQELLRINLAKYNAGVLPELDVLQAKADVAARQQLLVNALQAVEDLSDQLKNQLAEIGDMRDVTLVPLDLPGVPEYAVRGKEVAFIKEALTKRPEFAQVRLALEQAEIRKKVAQNQTLPQLDLFARYLALGVDNSSADAWDGTRSNDYGNWRVGLQFSYPLQNRSAKYRLKQAENALRQASLLMEKAQDDIILDVKSSIRAVETNRQQIEVGMATVEFNREKVDTGMKRQAVGLATSFEVLRFQSDLASARSNLLRAVIEYNKSIIQLERAKGSLLENLGITSSIETNKGRN
ncbi:MAG: TolC family protein [Candidatus Sumerlaeaceae bacterium]|nr:TolC family protein [Candidatus Sumerlaeaceae bacterium]